ncbi:fatty acid desaturase [Sorangium sp. So ce1099]|uniref:fatty acid desaturase n=1 Tax=Sorangium sp. So ce1099 TaxID=3133331 RepID=UPI003F614563
MPRVAWGTVALFSGLFTGWSVALVGWVLGWLPPPAAMALSGASVFAASTVMHDASHNAVSRVRWLNSLLGHASASLLFLTFVHFKNVHLRHHRFTGDPERDPDCFTGEGPSWILPLRWATADVHYALACEAPGGGMSKRDARETRLSLAVVAAIALGLCLSGHAIDFVLFWLPTSTRRCRSTGTRRPGESAARRSWPREPGSSGSSRARARPRDVAPHVAASRATRRGLAPRPRTS